MWMHYDGPVVVRQELEVLRRARLQRHALILLLAGLHAGARAARRGGSPSVRRLSRRPSRTPAWARSRPSSSATCWGELGSRLAGGSRPVSRPLARVAAGLVRGGDRAEVRRALRNRRVAGLERDAAVRRARDERRDRSSGDAPSRPAPYARPGRIPADLTRRRSLGHRGLGRRQRLLTSRSCAARRLRRPARVPDAGRPDAAAPGRVRLAISPASLGQPVVLEEFGVSFNFASDENASHLLPAGPLRRSWQARAGWIAWNNCDFDDLRDEDPYRHHVFEMHFGLTDRSTGRRRSSCALSPTLPRRCGELGRTRGGTPVKGDVGIIVPEHFERELPFTHTGLPAATSETTCSSPTSPRAKRTSLSRSCGNETASPARRTCTSPPCAKLLTAPGLDDLRALAVGGATVYLSYFAGSTHNQRGPWLTLARRDLRGPPIAFVTASSIRSRTTRRSSTSSRTSATSPLERSFPSPSRASTALASYLPVDSVGAQIVAIDGPRPPRPSSTPSSASAPPCPAPLPHRAYGGEAPPTPTRRAPGVSIPHSRWRRVSRGRCAWMIPVSSSG